MRRVLVFGGVFCHLFAPETSQEQLGAVSPEAQAQAGADERPANAH